MGEYRAGRVTLGYEEGGREAHRQTILQLENLIKSCLPVKYTLLHRLITGICTFSPMHQFIKGGLNIAVTGTSHVLLFFCTRQFLTRVEAVFAMQINTKSAARDVRMQTHRRGQKR